MKNNFKHQVRDESYGGSNNNLWNMVSISCEALIFFDHLLKLKN